MAAVDDARQILEGMSQKTLTNQIMIDAVKNYIEYDESLAWTNEQIAQKFINEIKARTLVSIRGGAERLARKANESAVTATGDASIADL